MNRRNLLTGAISLAALQCGAAKAWFPHGSAKGVFQGALSGGGFLMEAPISDDGLTRLITYDSSNAWIWSGSQFVNLFGQYNVPSEYQTWGQGSTYEPNAFSARGGIGVCATVSTRIYMVAKVSQAGTQEIWRSDDRGVSWTALNYFIPTNFFLRPLGPRVAVDPNDPDTCYISDAAGVVYRTQNAGVSWTILNASSGILDGVLPSAATSQAASSGITLTFSATPAALTGKSSAFTAFATDTTNHSALLLSSVSSTTSTTAVLSATIPASPGVGSGDNIVFGCYACIVFDRNSGTDANGRTKGIYIGWGWGASAVYHSTDSGASFASISGPAQVSRLECSRDGVLYACDYTAGSAETNTHNAWKYQSGSWTNFTITSGNTFQGVAADPLNAGHVCFASASSGLQMSGDYGATWWTAAVNNFSTRVATDVPWLGPTSTLENFASLGSIVFDPVSSGLLWDAEGIGLWSTTPTPNGGHAAPAFTMTSRNLNQQGLIVDQIIKLPGNNLLLAVQDRSGFSLNSLTQEPTNDFGITLINGSLTSGWAIDYAKNNSAFLVLVASGGLWTSLNSGSSWTKMATQPLSGAAGAIAVSSSSTFVYFPPASSPQYWNGSAWANCSFNGSSITTGWSFSLFLNRHNVVVDLSDGSFYAFNYNSDSTGGLWKSTDGGATWSNVAAISVFLALTGNATTGGDDFQMISVPGNAGHLMIGFGDQFGGAPLIRTINGGIDWFVLPGISVAWQGDAGAIKPGSSYPAVVFAGTCSTDPAPTDPGIFIASDVSGSDTSATPTWTRLSRAPNGNMDTVRSLCADKETWGRFYLGRGSTGYSWGQA